MEMRRAPRAPVAGPCIMNRKESLPRGSELSNRHTWNDLLGYGKDYVSEKEDLKARGRMDVEQVSGVELGVGLLHVLFGESEVLLGLIEGCVPHVPSDTLYVDVRPDGSDSVGVA